MKWVTGIGVTQNSRLPVFCCRSVAGNGKSRRVQLGDLVRIHFSCKEQDGTVLESTRQSGEPLTFEVGAGDIIGNRILRGLDEAVRDMQLGESRVLETQGGEWNSELLFKVPVDHPEIERLKGIYRRHGGLNKGMVVELINKQLALVVDIDDAVVTLDANNMMAGKQLTFEISLEEILASD